MGHLTGFPGPGGTGRVQPTRPDQRNIVATRGGTGRTGEPCLLWFWRFRRGFVPRTRTRAISWEAIFEDAFITIRKRMGIEPTQERLHAPAPDLKSGSPTSELGASTGNVLDPALLGKPFFSPFRGSRFARKGSAPRCPQQPRGRQGSPHRAVTGGVHCPALVSYCCAKRQWHVFRGLSGGRPVCRVRSALRT